MLLFERKKIKIYAVNGQWSVVSGQWPMVSGWLKSVGEVLMGDLKNILIHTLARPDALTLQNLLLTPRELASTLQGYHTRICKGVKLPSC
jgi:hypothetical protein